MPYVLTTGSTIKCAHQGTVVLVASQQLLTVDGQPVLVQGDLDGATIPDCQAPVTPSSSKCTTVTAMLVGVATTLTVGGKPVLLDTAFGMTNGFPVPGNVWTVQSAGQTKLAAR
jgi:uncharacterized Zn-binding protein involved in type VI secretion